MLIYDADMNIKLTREPEALYPAYQSQGPACSQGSEIPQLTFV